MVKTSENGFSLSADINDTLLKAYLAGGEYGYEIGIIDKDSLATAYKAGYKNAVEKACELIRLHIGVDLPVRLSPDGQPLAEDFFNHAEARAEAAQKVVEQFRESMEL